MTRISRLTAVHVRIPLRTTIRHASHARRSTDSLVVRCELADGTAGWGEGLPREYVTGETIAAAFPLLQATPLASQLGAELHSPADAIAVCESLRLTRPEADPRNCYGNAIRCAVELSVLDAACRHFGQPLADIVRQYAPAAGIRQSRQQVRYSAVITSSSPRRQRLKSWLIRLYGFQQTKVKVGAAGIDDEASLRRIRGILGSRADIRIDANEAWACDDLEARLAPLLPFGISSVEQPVPHHEVAGLSGLRGTLPVPIMLDESLCSLEDARCAIESGTCDLFNIRLSKCGGLLPSLRIAAAAHQAGLGCQLGCQVGETGILSAAGRHFATSVAGLRFLEGSYDRFLVRERLTAEDLTFGRGGCAPALTKPGLGVTVDPRRLERVTVETLDIPIARS